MQYVRDNIAEAGHPDKVCQKATKCKEAVGERDNLPGGCHRTGAQEGKRDHPLEFQKCHEEQYLFNVVYYVIDFITKWVVVLWW